jgi:hypothetical protein
VDISEAHFFHELLPLIGRAERSFHRRRSVFEVVEVHLQFVVRFHGIIVAQDAAKKLLGFEVSTWRKLVE